VEVGGSGKDGHYRSVVGDGGKKKEESEVLNFGGKVGATGLLLHYV